MNRRLPDNKPVSITISAELAEALLKHGPQLLDALKHQAVLAEQYSSANKAQHQTDLNKRRDEHRRIGTQAYRRWRRLDKSMFKTRHFAMAALAEEFQLSKTYVDFLISSRRNAVDQYLRKRRAVSVATLYLQGKNNAEIADAVGVGTGSVSRIIRHNKETIERVRWRLRQRETRQ